MTDTKAYIAKQIKAFREERRWNQDELGSMLDNQRGGGTVSSWENGRTTPDPETLLDLCRIFRVDISDFYPNDEINAADGQDALLHMYKRMNKQGRDALLACAKGLSSVFPGDSNE